MEDMALCSGREMADGGRRGRGEEGREDRRGGHSCRQDIDIVL